MLSLVRPVEALVDSINHNGSMAEFVAGLDLKHTEHPAVVGIRLFGSYHWLPHSEKHLARDLDLLFVVRGKGARFKRFHRNGFKVNAVVVGEDSLEKEAKSKGFGFFSSHVVSPGREIKGKKIFDMYKALAVKTAMKPIARFGGVSQAMPPEQVLRAIETWWTRCEPDFIHKAKSVREPTTRFGRWLATRLIRHKGWMDYPEQVDNVVAELTPHFEQALKEKLPSPTRFPRLYSAWFKPATLAKRITRQLVTMRRIPA